MPTEECSGDNHCFNPGAGVAAVEWLGGGFGPLHPDVFMEMFYTSLFTWAFHRIWPTER